MEKKFGIIALSNFSNRANELNKGIQELAGSDQNFLIKANSIRFANGEGKVTIEESVRNKTIFIVSDVSNYNITYKMFNFDNHMSPDDHFQDIKRVISAIAGKAEKIILVTPLLYEARQHRRQTRESLDCAMALQEIERLGVDAVITFDAHDPNIQNAVSTMSFDSFFPSYPILKTFIKTEKHKIDKDHMVVISPDTGAMQRTIKYASMLGLDVGMFYKRRDFTQVINGKNPVVQHEYLGRDITGKYVLIVDDMIASGGSVIDIVNEFKEKGAKGAYVICTFSFFTEGVERFRKLHESGALKKIYTTNLSYIPEEYKNEKWLHVVDLVPFMSKIIWTMVNNESIAGLLDSHEKLKKLLLAHNLDY